MVCRLYVRAFPSYWRLAPLNGRYRRVGYRIPIQGVIQLIIAAPVAKSGRCRSLWNRESLTLDLIWFRMLLRTSPVYCEDTWLDTFVYSCCNRTFNSRIDDTQDTSKRFKYISNLLASYDVFRINIVLIISLWKIIIHSKFLNFYF